MIKFIAALDAKRGIANEHGIPWQGKLPTDVAYFRSNTLHGTVMMGYGWYIEQEKPLPERKNLVATTKPEKLRPGFELVTNAREYLQQTNEDVWVGGGAGLFTSTLDLADELYLTLIDADFNCTKFFPEYENDFECIKQSEQQTENGITFRFTIWKRKKAAIMSSVGNTKKEYLQSAMFGFNDALVSTTGVIVGVSTGTANKEVVVLAGTVTILVEALSMGSGQYLSSKSAHQLEKSDSFRAPLISGVIMFGAYFLAGLVPLLPIVLFPIDVSREVSIVAALIGLFILGYYKGKVVKVSPIKSAIEILVIGGLATMIGIVVGNIFAV